MLNISGIHEGFVLDHIKAGMSLQIYNDLKLDQLDCTVAIIKNAKSNKMGKKDIIKVECPVEALDLDILGFIDHTITVNVIKGDKYIEKKYPYNIHYNICIFGKYALHNFKYTESNILKYIEDNNLIKINLKQGYSKCSICIVDENSIITSDKGIYNTVKEYNIDCLLIDEGHIDLFDLNYGFIGGCSGLISKNKIAFLGDITKHPDYIKIKEFLTNKNKEIVCLSKENLLDLGSIIPLMTRKEK